MYQYINLLQIKLILFFILSFSVSSTTAQNLLINPGFEDGLTGWTATGSQVEIVSGEMAFSGEKAVRLCTNSSVTQILPAHPGEGFTLMYRGKIQSCCSISQFRYLNTEYQVIANNAFHGSNSLGNSRYGVVHHREQIAPANTAYVQVIFAVADVYHIGNTCMHIDEVTLKKTTYLDEDCRVGISNVVFPDSISPDETITVSADLTNYTNNIITTGTIGLYRKIENLTAPDFGRPLGNLTNLPSLSPLETKTFSFDINLPSPIGLSLNEPSPFFSLTNHYSIIVDINQSSSGDFFACEEEMDFDFKYPTVNLKLETVKYGDCYGSDLTIPIDLKIKNLDNVPTTTPIYIPLNRNTSLTVNNVNNESIHYFNNRFYWVIPDPIAPGDSLLLSQPWRAISNRHYYDLTVVASIFEEESNVKLLNRNNGTIVTHIDYEENCLSPESCTNDLMLSTQAEIDAFPNCEVYNGNIEIRGEDIHSLLPLNNLIEIKGCLSIYNTPNLINLNGLDNLKSVNSLTISNSVNLESVASLNELEWVEISLVLIQLDKLSSLEGLGDLKETKRLALLSLPEITTLEPLRNLKVTELVDLTNNVKLTTLNGLRATTQLESLGITVTGLKNLAGLENLREVGELEIIGNPDLVEIKALSDLSRVERLHLNLNEKLDCCGIYPVVATSDTTRFLIIANQNCNSVQDILENCADRPFDLKLSLLATEPNLAQYESSKFTLQVTNEGTLTATNIAIDFSNENIVLTNGQSPNFSTGTFNFSGDQIWRIPTLATGATATLETNYFFLAEPFLYAQITAANGGTDTDSTPNNGDGQRANEDDEVVFAPMVNRLPDLVLSNPRVNTAGTSGGILDYLIDVENRGMVMANGEYIIRVYLSSNNTLDANDVEVGIIPTGNTPVGTIPDVPGAITIPAETAGGSYQLILVTDADDQIRESNEDNNVTQVSITILNSTADCVGDVILTRQEEIDNFGDCTVYDGNIRIRGAQITNLQNLRGLQKVTGSLSIYETSLTNLDGLQDLREVKTFGIIYNDQISTVTALSQLERVNGFFAFVGNAQLMNLNGLENLTFARSIAINSHENLTSLQGLENTFIQDSLIMSSNPNLTYFDVFQNVTSLEVLDLVFLPKVTSLQSFVNLMTVEKNIQIVGLGIQDINGLENLRTIGRSIIFASNPALRKVDAFQSLTSVGNQVIFNGNDLLTNCCGLVPAINNPNVEVIIVGQEETLSCINTENVIESCENDNCNIIVTIFDKVCEPDDTPDNQSDNTFGFKLRATATEGSNNFRIESPIGYTETYTYGTDISILSLPITEEIIRLVITDSENVNCRTEIDVVPPPFCPEGGGSGQLANIELDIQHPTTFRQYKGLSIVYTITNTGDVAANDIKVNLPLPTGAANTNFTTTTGDFQLYAETWTIPNLVAGASTTLTWNIFALAENTITGSAQIMGQEAIKTFSINRSNFRLGADNRTPDQWSAIKLYPTISQDWIQLSFLAQAEGKTKVEIFTVQGQRITQQRLEAEIGFNQYTLNIANLTAGTYFLKIGQETLRFVKL